MISVLDGPFAERLAKRYARRAPWELPSVLRIATSPDRESQRAWLNAVLEVVPEAVRNRVLSRLQKEPNFLATYNELATAAILLKAGYPISYESEVAGRTPDLLLPAGDGRPTVLVEVSTRFRTDAQRRNEKRWVEFKRRVEKIPVPLWLYVRRVDLGMPEPPDSGKAKRVTEALEEVLPAATPPFNKMFIVEDFAFGIASPAPGAHALFAPPIGGSAYDADLVLEVIGEKVSRYAAAAKQAGAVLVVVLAAEPLSPLTLDLLRTTLTGAQAVTMTIDVFDPTPIRTRSLPMRRENSPPGFDSAVSAVGWLAPGINDPGRLTLFPLASAGQRVQFSESDALVIERMSTATLNEHGETFNVSTAGTNAMATLCVASRSCQGRKSSM